MKKRIRLEDIAIRAGVSKMTVSLALRQDPSISKDTIKLIQDIASEIGYVPNQIAKSLTSGKSNIIAALVGGSMHDDYQNQFLRGAIDHATVRGYSLTIGLTDQDKKLEKSLINKISEIMVDGFLAFHCFDEANYRFLKERQIPFVLYTKYFDGFDCDYVVCDDVKGGYLMTKHFLGLGHKRVAFVYDANLENSSEIVNRSIGCKKALEEKGIPIDNELIIPYSYHLNSLENNADNSQLLKCIQSSDAPTAIFVCNDVVTSAFYKTIKSMGLKIPEDISIGGYEGVYLSSILDPPLTTISTPIYEMGKTACKLLIDKIEGDVPQDQITKLSLEPVLTIRQSTLRR